MSPPVTMLTKPQCVQCSMTARQLDLQGIAFAAPIVVVGDMDSEDFDAWTGFRPDRIEALAAGERHE